MNPHEEPRDAEPRAARQDRADPAVLTSHVRPGPVAGLRLDAVTMDAVDAPALAAWWAAITGGQVHEHFGFFVVMRPDDHLPMLGFQQVADRTPGKNATHLDLRVPDLAGAVTMLLGCGATRVGQHSLPDGFVWEVLADPEGNQFCLLPLPGPH